MSDLDQLSTSSSEDKRYVTTVVVDSSLKPATILVNGTSIDEMDNKELPMAAQRRKVSLMPMVTEEDIRMSGLGQKDPISVAQVFGKDFASRFCVPVPTTPNSPSPPPYDTKDKMLIREVTVERQKLPYELRDENLPRGVPALKVRVKKPFQLNSSVSFEDVSVPLPPSTHNFVFSQTLDLSLRSELPNLAAKHNDLEQFQIVFNEWMKNVAGCLGSAFILNSTEDNCSVCRVCALEPLEKQISCGDTEHFTEVLGFVTSNMVVPDDNNSHDYEPSTSKIIGPTIIDTREIKGHLFDPVSRIVCKILKKQADIRQVPASICAVMTGSGFCTALLIVHQSENKRNEELKALLPHFGMIASLTSVAWNVEEQRRIAQQSQLVLSMTQSVFSSLQDMQLLVRNITKEAKALVSAEICSLFLLDAEHDELVAEVFEQTGNSDNNEYLQEIRMPLNQGIVGHVATTGELMNVKDVYNHPYFYPNVDQQTGFKTRNILCFPIKDSSGNLVGVAELCNKIDKPAFTLHDEQVAMTFAVYCAISISHCLLYRKLQEAHRRSNMAAELLVQGSTLSIAPEDILRLTVREIPKPESFHPKFSELCFVPRSIGTGDTYVEAALSMFQELGFIEQYRLKRRTLARFILMVQKGYRDVPYHNWSHAFAVAHFCYLLCKINTVKDFLTNLERLSLLVACLCHDIDHRGTTNAFQVQSKTPLAQLYSSEGSVLERHHFAQTVTILGMDECNIFETLTRSQYQSVLDNIREVILATDIAAHLRKVDRIQEMAEAGYDRNSSDHHYLFMCLLMTASDLSDQSKDFKNSKAIAASIYKEFFSQGDLEKQMGNLPIEMMDRERACVPKIQIQFMDDVALPVFEHLGKIIPETMETYNSFKHNRTCWDVLGNILTEESVPQEGLTYLKDEDLEQKVLERVPPSEEPSGSEASTERQ